MLINRSTLNTRPENGDWTLPDGSVMIGDLRTLRKQQRELGWYLLVTVEGDSPCLVWDDYTMVCRQTVLPDTRVETLRQVYRDSSRALCTLAGEEPVDKLEDAQYLVVRDAARAADPTLTTSLTENLLYTLFQLYRLDGDDAWSRI